MIKLILMAALLFVSGASMAQRVVVGKNGEAIIDNRAMPAGAITAAKKSRTTNATNSAMGTNDESNLASQESNKTVSHYFEVMKADITSTAGVTWLEAVNSCKNHDNGDHNNTWRAPTQRELMLIWTLYVPLMRVPGFTAYSYTGNQWGATEFPTNAVSYVNFYYGWSYVEPWKSNPAGMRCIRDLDPQ